MRDYSFSRVVIVLINIRAKQYNHPQHENILIEHVFWLLSCVI